MEKHPVIDAALRFQQHDISNRVQRIKDLSGLPAVHFERFYKVPILKLVQTLAYLENDALLRHLDSIIAALKLRRALMLPIGLDAESVNAKRDLWTYGIFVSSLLYRLHDLLAYTVIVNPSNKTSCFRWNPFDLPISPGVEVTIHKVESYPTSFNAAFFSYLFDGACMTWLSRDKDVFEAVLKLIVSPSIRTELGALILKAHGEEPTKTEKAVPDDAPLEVEEIKQSPKKDEIIEERSEPTNLEASESKLYGEATPPEKPTQTSIRDEPLLAFERWLIEVLSQRSSRSVICELPNGFGLSDPEVFQEFLQQKECKTLKRAFIKKYGPFEKVDKLNFGEGRVRRGLVLPVDWNNQKQFEFSTQDRVV